ncbi:MAG: tRNA pseudouridine synthase B [Chlamydiia bacterium]|nr:tRNA pseudouridine synthase B [Chlamydiia bacterium]MCH9618706.1 tRNA pseudouridine synthase B [Chlamydiia bacterium]MCH9624386.1 tRNA pseudouridine synthase B [Chlamydiia bacterium]
MTNATCAEKLQGILLVNKEKGRTSFSLIPKLRSIFNEKKIGHGGTLDPLATGVMVYLVGKKYTKTADTYLLQDKEYEAVVRLGEERDSYDIDGTITATSDIIPSLEEIEQAIPSFNGVIDQIPPMFSAKKVNGKKLYELARNGEEIVRKPKRVTMQTEILSYHYPKLKIKVTCSSGTYIRSIAHDLGQVLKCYGCIEELKRTRSGIHTLENCFSEEDLDKIRPLSSLLKKDEG